MNERNRDVSLKREIMFLKKYMMRSTSSSSGKIPLYNFFKDSGYIRSIIQDELVDNEIALKKLDVDWFSNSIAACFLYYLFMSDVLSKLNTVATDDFNKVDNLLNGGRIYIANYDKLFGILPTTLEKGETVEFTRIGLTPQQSADILKVGKKGFRSFINDYYSDETSCREIHVTLNKLEFHNGWFMFETYTSDYSFNPSHLDYIETSYNVLYGFIFCYHLCLYILSDKTPVSLTKIQLYRFNEFRKYCICKFGEIEKELKDKSISGNIILDCSEPANADTAFIEDIKGKIRHPFKECIDIRINPYSVNLINDYSMVRPVVISKYLKEMIKYEVEEEVLDTHINDVLFVTVDEINNPSNEAFEIAKNLREVADLYKLEVLEYNTKCELDRMRVMTAIFSTNLTFVSLQNELNDIELELTNLDECLKEGTVLYHPDLLKIHNKKPMTLISIVDDIAETTRLVRSKLVESNQLENIPMGVLFDEGIRLYIRAVAKEVS